MSNKNIIVKYDIFRPFHNEGPRSITLDDIKIESFKKLLIDLTEHGIDIMQTLENEANDAFTREVFRRRMTNKTESFFEERRICSQKVVCDETNNKEGASLEAVVYIGESIGVDYYGIEFSFDNNV